MKLSHDQTTYRASGIRVRDARHVHNGPEVPRPQHARKGGKDKKRWCGGKVGREHQKKCVDYGTTKRPCGSGMTTRPGYEPYAGCKILICTECGKELATYYASLGRVFRREKPAWVTD